MRFQALPGFRDFYPDDLAARRWVESAWHRASRAAGFQEIDAPVLEALELFTEKSGEGIVDQLYAFQDKGGRSVALRAEMTPSLARMVGARAGGMPKPIKWYCLPELYRYEKPQRGRTRAHVQWNVDVVGADEPASDAEVMAVAVDALRLLGLGPGDVGLFVNDRRLVSDRLRSIDVGPDDEPAVLSLIDRLERDASAADALRKRLGGARAKQVLAWCESMPLEAADGLAGVLEACRDFGLGDYLVPDFRIVRGLDYYTGPVWEIFDRGRTLRSVAGGGRYDRLVAALGGPDLPALGFGMGDAVLGELLRERGLVPATPPRVEVAVVPVGEEMLGPSRRVLRRLRDRGVSADAPYAAQRVGRALKAADAAGARRAVLVGPEEWKDESVLVRDLVSGEEKRVRLDELE